MIDTSDDDVISCYCCRKETVTVDDGVQLCDRCRNDAQEVSEDYANKKADEYATERASLLAVNISIEQSIDLEIAYQRTYYAEFKVAFAELFRDRLDKIIRRKLGEAVEDEEWDN